MMRCKKACEYLSLEIDGLLPPVAAPDLEKHLDACSECRSYRADLRMSRRLLDATDPQLAENFEWRLQLRLNQTLQEVAGQAAYPWVGSESNSWNWLRNFGSAAAVGMAAVLAVALFLGPSGYQTTPALVGSEAIHVDDAVGGDRVASALTDPVAVPSDRLPLWGGRSGNSRLYGGSSQRVVSSGGLANVAAAPFDLDRGWSGQKVEDLRTIQRLRSENQQLAKLLYQMQRRVENMRAQLDTNTTRTLDLKLEP